MPEIDALFESINVRDLLAGHDLNDPTTPLSAPDLRLLINRLESHSLRIKSKVQSYLVAHHSDFSELFSLCQDTVSRTRLISDDVSDVLQLVSDRPIDVEIRSVVDEITEKTKEVKLKRESLDLVNAIVGICEALQETKEALKNGRFRFAAERIRELKVVLRIGEEEDGEPVAYALLRKEWSNCFDEIQEVLAKFMENAVRFELDSSRIRIKYQLSVGETAGIALSTVLEAMEVIGILDYGLAKAADSIFKHVITPAVTHASTFAAVEDLCKSAGEVTEATLRLEQSSDHKFEDVDGDAMYSGILKVVKFICSSLCFGNVTWIHSFGRLTWPRISELIISKFLSKVVPEDASKLADFQKIIERTSQFEAALKELNFVSSSDAESRLSKYAEDVEVHFASRKKIEILAKARNLLLQCNFTIPQDIAMRNAKHIVCLLFSSERCVVSEAASQLMNLVHKTLEDVCVSSARVASEFYNAARDSILLYEAVVPVKLEKQLDGLNEAAVLLHNDCLYLFEEILGLAFEYRASFPSSIKEYAVFADIAPRFKLMAEEVLQKQVHLVISSLREAIDSADGFQNTHQIKQFKSAEFSIDQVVFSLKNVHMIWEPVLRPKTYKQSMCAVLESVFRRIARDILLLDDMAADETFELQKLIYLMLKNLSSVLDSVRSADETSRPLDDIIPSLRKTRKLAELLDMPLMSITSAWESGELFRCNFTRTEVQDFIKAIFTDSPLRKECLWRIDEVNQ
ncbi:centromere/kinetochore protein, putative (ZW10) [Arabidopsis thaliana]|uniref:Centromere/kinetochore protein zw10 homolog n=1 Tax=Arabidopsis thaliana TaxID=3702 RepID=ZW10_ARATH|nr:centromere/kinetochore protein, putative (ZW10) [Arabidopsis thaliana]O48626.1 RecName: Full=Centromere/kinetochore protein zw10 homolog; Short=AtZW10; AltName: Full=MAG2-interacting protein 1 [Arabidopsis thaliana]AAB88246.1 AtZW10 [Arabidopsis thaliana]AAL47437.1 At2g32900/T21L14.16 [Arabidopsis thaliana]AEC08759.1 centromere/kinetochore protein, putative (ZW10) [Arabidopsis thaliana]|eukprot:NP_565757.2 centromere/kinetochore protein, putative (ZW10) [Arabidopsis thaliana]